MRMVAASRQRRQGGVSVPSCVCVFVYVCVRVCASVYVCFCVSHTTPWGRPQLFYHGTSLDGAMKIQDRGSLEDLRRECKCALVSRLRFGDGCVLSV